MRVLGFCSQTRFLLFYFFQKSTLFRIKAHDKRIGGNNALTDRKTDVQTGYPSVDKPWLRYYSQEQIDAKLPQYKIFDYIYSENKNHESTAAFNYYGRKITYGQFFEATEQTAKAFLNLGVKEHDVVAIIAVSIPEVIYSFYGLNRIGAISNMIDPRTSAEGIREYLLETKTTVVVVLDVAYPKIKKAIVDTSVKSVIVVSPADSLPPAIKCAYRLTKGKVKVSKEHLLWGQFIAGSEGQKLVDSPYKEKECCVIVHTGGTTGVPKGVMLTNDNLNQSAFQLINSEFNLNRGDIWADIMPPFIAYGIGNGLHMPLIKGMEVVLVPAFDPKKYDDLMIKYNPTHIVGVPSHYENIINSKKMRHREISYLVSPVVGGDSMKPELEKKVNEFIKAHSGQNNVMKGYGMTEVSAAVSACMSDRINKIGSVGIPFAHTIISVFDTETGKELKYGEKGEVCMTGPNTMLGYYENEEETQKILRNHSDGLIWVHSGDIGYMDEDGFLYIEGRIKRIIVRHDGFKVFPSFIEDVVIRNNKVKECCAVGSPDHNHAQGMLPVVFVVLSEEGQMDKERTINELIEICESELPEYAQPRRIRIIEKLPLTPIGKIDYRSLERECT